MIPAPVSDEIYIDTPPAYRQDRMFDLSNLALNRDGTLVPYARVREAHASAGRTVRTADYLMSSPANNNPKDYYSLGVLDNFKMLAARPDVHLRAFLVLEPPVVDPSIYKALPELTAAFERVYVHNVSGDGYSLAGVNSSRLRQLYWPQPREDVMEPYWSRRDRLNRIVVINGNHVPRKVPNELYSRRIEAMTELAESGVVDLYGRGWAKLKARTSLWWPYISRRKTLLSIYRGSCESKYEVLSQYNFCLCLENMAMQGYVTEKIFDCFYAGTIPLYLGAPDIKQLIPKEAYIDCREFSSWQDAYQAAAAMSPEAIQQMREHGQHFVRSEQGRRYTDSLLKIVGDAS